MCGGEFAGCWQQQEIEEPVVGHRQWRSNAGAGGKLNAPARGQQMARVSIKTVRCVRLPARLDAELAEVFNGIVFRGIHLGFAR